MLEFSYERNHFMHKFFENFSVRVSFWVLAALLFFLTFSPIFPYIIAMLAAFTVGIPLFLYPRKKGEGFTAFQFLAVAWLVVAFFGLLWAAFHVVNMLPFVLFGAMLFVFLVAAAYLEIKTQKEEGRRDAQVPDTGEQR